jgi:hypothetical protein
MYNFNNGTQRNARKKYGYVGGKGIGIWNANFSVKIGIWEASWWALELFAKLLEIPTECITVIGYWGAAATVWQAAIQVLNDFLKCATLYRVMD